MQITLATALSLCATTALATQILESRADKLTHLFVCTEKAWAGTCKNIVLNIGKCYNMGDALNNSVSSAGPDDGTFCTLYSERGCHGNAVPFTNPGIPDFTKYKFDNELSSVRCDFIWGWTKKSE